MSKFNLSDVLQTAYLLALLVIVVLATALLFGFAMMQSQ